MGKKRMTYDAFSQMKNRFKVPAIDLLLVTPNRDLLLVMPHKGAAAGKWAFPGTLAHNGPAMQKLALQYANKAFDWSLESIDVRYFSRDERTWPQKSGILDQYLVDIMEVRVPGECRDLSRITLPDKYSEIAWFSRSEVAKSKDCHLFVGHYYSLWCDANAHRALNW